ncbi:MAG: hypothetical protein UR69_C0002G0023 [Candidatus Moranbacteria bacterium GW2011_GWE2_35_2-]|nr:MAG: hypothetical protein UR69_C0002G0023 [Candidatus Moranbacteria bacterium GW2011_GWE2_35_2-]KKQ22628.1 MAG: hypothetical protein US37_C0002G0253 [Candidatus Moranbacteria bacterium GW2011_GWF2_37_11]KKQ29031.1 MAG: hypothetical protein US44_C0004G0075 [Candidatus Moranbacteria bacterium GW2011_GWD1_37_17]KKQ30433.1 MAG: hypothetical protein US47_C0002G0023 [Candidatus Moranbacteria bacterium GW2011_GWE1_37_24]KKQ47913.1 MAG: hypothetical protein US66_C0004G0023 [Candidatus Moranbacteria 
MKDLSSLIKKRNKKVVTDIVLDDKTVFYIFDKIIKSEYGLIGSVRVRPDYFKNGKLFVKTQSSAWASEVFLDRKRITEKINRELGGKEIIEIVIKK